MATRQKLHVRPEYMRDPVLRNVKFAALLKDGTVITGRIGYSTTIWFGYYVDDKADETLRVAFSDIDTVELG